MNNPKVLLKYINKITHAANIQPQITQFAQKAKNTILKGTNISELLPKRNTKTRLYNPTLYLSHPFLQVVYNISEPKLNLDYEREKIFFHDGGHVSLDWAKSLRKNGDKFEQYQPQTTAPIFFVMHGLTGGSQMNYIKVLIQEARVNGFRSVCLNSRGICSEMTSPIPFTALDFHELEEALEIIENRYPGAPIYMVGTSFGANYLTRYLIETNRPTVKGFVALATPFDLNQVVKQMAPVYQKFFVKRYIEQTVKKHHMMKFWEEIGVVDMKQVFASKNLSEFHSNLTIKIVNQDNVQNLFKRYSIGPEIKNLNVPSLFMNSTDDPIVSCSSIPEELKSNSNLELVITESGGHLCWYEGIVPKRWYPKPTIKFLKKLLQH